MWHPNFKFPEVLKTAKAEDKSKYFEEKFVLIHDKIGDIKRKLEIQFFGSREQQIALIVGPTGVGKSCLAHSLLTECYKDLPVNQEVKSLPMIYFEADVHSKANFSWKYFYKQLLSAMGELEYLRIYGQYVSVGSSGARKLSSLNRSEEDLKDDLIKRLKEYGVGYILIDEIQHIFKYGGKLAERNLDILKNISNKSRCRFIGLGTYEVSFSVDKSAQLARRILNIEFSAYSSVSAAEFQSFKSAYIGMLAHMPIEMSKEVASYANEIFIGCCGCIGILKEWLNRALVAALSEDAQLNISHLKQTRLKGSQLMPVAQEIKEGRAFFEEPDDKQIAELLGMAKGAPASRVNQVAPVQNVVKRRPGERKPSRDQVL